MKNKEFLLEQVKKLNKLDNIYQIAGGVAFAIGITFIYKAGECNGTKLLIKELTKNAK